MLEKFFRWVIFGQTQFFPHKVFKEVIFSSIRRGGLLMIPAQSLEKSKGLVCVYSDPERAAVVELVNKVKEEVPFLLTVNEAYQLYMSIKQVLKIQGDIAEVGVYHGGSAKLICEAKGEKFLHLFDTFSGLPQVDPIDQTHFQKGQYSASLSGVKEYLKGYSQVSFYPGIFPQTAEPIKDRRFAFVNLDVDTYESTKACFNFFYQRMNAGGIIFCDDYNYAPGVKKAVDEFFFDKPEPVIEMLGSQCLMVKL